jgi:hypothetical protein
MPETALTHLRVLIANEKRDRLEGVSMMTQIRGTSNSGLGRETADQLTRRPSLL